MQNKLTYFSRRILAIVFTLTLFTLATPLSVYAQNRVVVIPMAGDDVIVEVPAELTPTTPIANDDTNQNDYTIGALTAIDNVTKLEWQRQDDGIARSWDEAWTYCLDLALDNRNDWRLPQINELLSIVDYGRVTQPFIDPVAFTNTRSSFYWTATNVASNSSRAWASDTGSTARLFKTDDRSVRCVR